MNQVRNTLNLSNPTYQAFECTHDAPTISLSTFRYMLSPTYVAEVYANYCSKDDLRTLLACAPPVMEIHLIDGSLPGSADLRKAWKYNFLEQLNYPPVPAPHPSLNPPPHRLRLRKLNIIQFTPIWFTSIIKRLGGGHNTIHWRRLVMLMQAHAASFPGHVARKFVVLLCKTNGPYDAIIRSIASLAATHHGSTVGLVPRDHERFGFVEGKWRLELELDIPSPRYYIEEGKTVESIL